MDEASRSFVATLAPAEIEAAASRYGLRVALQDRLTAGHHAPLAAFVLAVAFATILATTGFIGRRTGEIALLLAASLFMIHRLAVHRRIWRARMKGRAEITRLMSGPVTTSFDADAVVQTSSGDVRRLCFAECRGAEEANGLIYIWDPVGAPVILPTRILVDGEAAALVAKINGQAPRPRWRSSGPDHLG